MSFWSFLYILVNIASVAALIYLIIILSPFKHVPASNAFTFLAGVLIFWIVILTNRVTFVFSPGLVFFLHRMTETIFLFLPMALVFLIDRFATETRIMQNWVYIMFAVVILVVLGLIWTNDLHHLYWQVESVIIEGNRLHILAQKTSPAKILMLVQHLIIVFAAFHFLNLILSLNIYFRKVIRATSISLALTTLFSAFVLISPIDTEYTLLPVALTAACICLALFITEHQIFDLAPISRASYFNQLADGAIVTSRQGNIIDISRKLAQTFGESKGKQIIGQDILKVFPDWKEPFHAIIKTKNDQKAVMSFIEDGLETQYDISFHANKDQYGFVATILIKFQDVTFYRQLLDHVNELAIRDPLTGVLNRRHFEILVLDHLKLAQRYERPGCLLMFDLDDFKHVNDFYGHQTGDKALAEFSRQMSSLMRDSDIFARYGGDEFVLYLPETNCDGALIAIEDLKKFILGTTIAIDDLIVPIKCSTGIVPITQETLHLSYAELIHQADKAMYAAKEKGPNVVGIIQQEEITFSIVTHDKQN